MTRPGHDEVVLLTGFPSFAARKLCEELLLDRGTFVHAVVPARHESAARQALDACSASARARVNLLEGDASAMDFGLSGAELNGIRGEVDRIHHVAQVPPSSADRKLAEPDNLGGARELVEVARVCPALKCAVFHSTARVSGDRVGLVLEADLDKGQELRSPADEALARGEKLVRAAMTKLPIAVVRPTIVLGDSRTGEVDRDGAPYPLIVILVCSPDLPLPTRPDATLHLVPVDYYVRAACAIGRHNRAPGRTFHVGDAAPLAARRIFELLASAGGLRRQSMAGNLGHALRRTPGFDRFTKSPRALVDALVSNVSYSFANTAELLAETDIRCPPLESYVERLVDHVQHKLREKRALDAEVDDPLV